MIFILIIIDMFIYYIYFYYSLKFLTNLVYEVINRIIYFFYIFNKYNINIIYISILFNTFNIDIKPGIVNIIIFKKNKLFFF